MAFMTSKKIGLALSGGGARGFAHVGALKVLVENGIPIDLIAGTSAGSIIGGAYASGMSIAGIEAMAEKAGWADLVRPSLSVGGMLSNAPLGRFLRRHFLVARFEDLAIPFSAVAFDLATNAQVTLASDGDLITAIRASCAVPGVFAPVRDELGRTLVDGGVISPLPVKTLRNMGADIVIAVDLVSCGATFRSGSRTGLGVMIQGALALLRAVAVGEQAGADVVIEPAIAHLRPDQINKRNEFTALGRDAALDKLDEIRRIIS